MYFDKSLSGFLNEAWFQAKKANREHLNSDGLFCFAILVT
jgi:hypothetical protein